MREAGLPLVMLDIHGENTLTLGSKGIVRAVHPERNRVDIETQDGSYLREVLVQGPYFPEVHKEGEAPSHVTYIHAHGQAEAFCWPETHRRLLASRDTLKDQAGQGEPERRYFPDHHYIFRVGDVTIRISRDDRLVLETEHGDYIILDTHQREIRLHAPTVKIGSDDESMANRVEYQQDDSFRAFNPLILLGSEAGDRFELRLGQEMLLQAPVIKLTATESITLDPPQIRLGADIATERLVLGDALQAYINAVVKAMIDTHVHSNVQNGGGTSGPPTTGFPVMPDTTLSTIARVSE